eukprot:TRINITY_DN5207_c0_g1_i2.p1 TRINITY_DN5207_c0_g1~~TRINITY_DN5207_c0_g1_i2.p1  ORF type:complete len:168 (+),score=12.87 TRINITY_DN5207_c0_g1_i2:29-505(+)
MPPGQQSCRFWATRVLSVVLILCTCLVVGTVLWVIVPWGSQCGDWQHDQDMCLSFLDDNRCNCGWCTLTPAEYESEEILPAIYRPDFHEKDGIYEGCVQIHNGAEYRKPGWHNGYMQVEMCRHSVGDNCSSAVGAVLVFILLPLLIIILCLSCSVRIR